MLRPSPTTGHNGCLMMVMMMMMMTTSLWHRYTVEKSDVCQHVNMFDIQQSRHNVMMDSEVLLLSTSIGCV